MPGSTLLTRATGLSPTSGRRPQRDEFVGLNRDSLQAQGLGACWPMWGGGQPEIDLVSGYIAYPTNNLSVRDPVFGQVYYGDNGNVPRGGGAPTIPRYYNIGAQANAQSGSTIATGYPANMDPGANNAHVITAKSASWTAWVKLVNKDGYILQGGDIQQTANGGNNPPNAYISSCASNTGAFPGWGFAVAQQSGSTPITVELDIDGGSLQTTIIGEIALNDGQWHHIAGIYEATGTTVNPTSELGGHMRVYVDGVLDVTELNGGAGGVNPQTVPVVQSWLDTSPWGTAIGADTDFVNAQWNGMFCDFRFYLGRALTSSDLQAMYHPETRWELYQPRRPSSTFVFGQAGAGNAIASGAVTLGALVPSGSGAFSDSGSGSVTLASLAIAASPAFTSPASGAVTLGVLTTAATPLFTSPSSGPITLGALTGSGAGAFATASSGAVTLGSLVVASTPGFLASGAGAVTLAALSASGTGAPQVFGSGTVTLGALSVSSSAAFSTPSSGAITLGSLAVAATPLFTTPASGAITLGSLIVAGTGVPQIFGSGAITLGALSASGAGSFAATATGPVTLGALTVSSTAAAGIFASGAITLGALGAAGSGAFTAPASGAVTLGVLGVAGAGANTTSGSAAITLGALTASGTAASGIFASGTLTLGALGVSASGAFATAASATVTLGALGASGTGAPGSSGSAAVTLGSLLASGAASAGTLASGTLTLGALGVSGTGVFTTSASGVLTLNSLSAAGSGAGTIVGSGAVTLGALTASGAGAAAITASGTITLGSLLALGSGGSGIFATGSITLGTLGVSGTGAYKTSVSGTITLASLSSTGSGAIGSTATGTIALAALTPVASGSFKASGSGSVLLSRIAAAGLSSTHPFAVTGGMHWGGAIAFVVPPLTTFRTTYIRQILAIRDSVDLRVSWVSLEAPGTWYQLYVNRKLTHWTQQLYTHIPYPIVAETFVVGAVPAAMAATDFSSLLPPTPQRRIELTWLGGRYLGADIAGFNVYLGNAPGQPVNYTNVVATIPAYSGHQVLDGFGEGGFGQGGFGSAASTYEWISDPVASGTWNVAVKSIDTLGNESSSALTGSVVISGPPEPPARDNGGARLHYTYNAATHEVTLIWLASPSF